MQHPEAPGRSSRYSKSFVFWLSLAQMVSWGTLFYSFSLLMQPLEQGLGLSRAQSSLAFSAALLTEGLLGYSVGWLIDRGHARAVMCTGSVFAAVGMAAHLFVQTAAALFAVWVLLGAAMACTLYSPAFSIVTRRFPVDFRRAIITLTFLGGLASTVFIPLTGWLTGLCGWRATMGMLACLHLLVCLPAPARLPAGARLLAAR